MIFALPQLLVTLVASIVISGGLGYWAGHGKGVAALQARWDAERVSQYQAIEKARQEAAEARQRADADLAKQKESYDAERRRQADASVATGRELQRLRDALATSALGHRERASAQGSGPRTDGAAAAAGELLAACGQALAGMGDDARRLAAQVIGLQGYARTAQKVCGD